MNDHLRVLQQWIEAEAICRANAAGDDGEGQSDEINQQKEKDLHAGEDGRGVGVQRDVGLVAKAKDEAVGGKQPSPEQQGTLLPSPYRRELVEAGQGRCCCDGERSRRRSRW